MELLPVNTSVMILAAGHGKRMLPLTQKQPKPLLKVGKHRLIEHHLLALAEQGFVDIVINHAYLGQQIVDTLGNGKRYGVNIQYSDESDTGALETAGGIRQALEIIGSDPFLVINGDVYTEYDYTSLLRPLNSLARLVLVNNPEHNPAGDFTLSSQQTTLAKESAEDKFTFSGIGLYQKALFADLDQGPRSLAPILRQAIAADQVETLLFNGVWHDIGTPERLQQLDAALNPANSN